MSALLVAWIVLEIIALGWFAWEIRHAIEMPD